MDFIEDILVNIYALGSSKRPLYLREYPSQEQWVHQKDYWLTHDDMEFEFGLKGAF